jgi:hypothetical protein
VHSVPALQLESGCRSNLAVVPGLCASHLLVCSHEMPSDVTELIQYSEILPHRVDTNGTTAHKLLCCTPTQHW